MADAHEPEFARFGALFSQALADAGLKQMDLVRAVGTVSSAVSDIAKGKKAPPLEKIERWARAMGLEGPRLRDFLLEARLTRCPVEIREDYLRLRNRVERLERRVAEYEEKYRP